ncbi:hypothetical protein TNCV_542511 [Trichonephila clavipes]|nr:hypothetical protein TNCV_542511 [Trichonephila clavipes]
MELKKRICRSKYYNDEVAKCLLGDILDEKREIKEREIREFEERTLDREFEVRKQIREWELERLRAQLRNKLKENELKAGNRINRHTGIFQGGGSRVKNPPISYRTPICLLTYSLDFVDFREEKTAKT